MTRLGPSNWLKSTSEGQKPEPRLSIDRGEPEPGHAGKLKTDPDQIYATEMIIMY